MALQLDNLGNAKRSEQGTFAKPPEGFNLLKIDKCVVKQGAAGPYFNVLFKNTQGSFFEIISTSEEPNSAFKLARFLRALNVPLQGTIELEDIAKIAIGKEIVVDVIYKIDNYKGEEREKAQSNMFENEIFYKADEFNMLTGTQEQADTSGTVSEAPPTDVTY